MYDLWEAEKLLSLPPSSWVMPNKFLLSASVSTQVKCVVRLVNPLAVVVIDVAFTIQI